MVAYSFVTDESCGMCMLNAASRKTIGSPVGSYVVVRSEGGEIIRRADKSLRGLLSGFDGVLWLNLPDFRLLGIQDGDEVEVEPSKLSLDCP